MPVDYIPRVDMRLRRGGRHSAIGKMGAILGYQRSEQAGHTKSILMGRSSAIHGVSIVVAINEKRSVKRGVESGRQRCPRVITWTPAWQFCSSILSSFQFITAELEVTKNRYSFYAQPLNN